MAPTGDETHPVSPLERPQSPLPQRVGTQYHVVRRFLTLHLFQAMGTALDTGNVHPDRDSIDKPRYSQLLTELDEVRLDGL